MLLLTTRRRLRKNVGVVDDVLNSLVTIRRVNEIKILTFIQHKNNSPKTRSFLKFFSQILAHANAVYSCVLSVS